MSAELARFVFRGRLSQAGVPFGFTASDVGVAPDGSALVMHYKCADGDFSCNVHTDFEWALPDLRNRVLARAIEIAAAASVFTGRYFDVEITSMQDTRTNTVVDATVHVPCLDVGFGSDELTGIMRELAQLSSPGGRAYLDRVLIDVWTSMRLPLETGFYCYRAVEALMKHAWLEQSDQEGIDEATFEKQKKKAWDFFRTSTGIPRSQIERLQNAARAPRHGGVLRSITDSERAELYGIFRRIFSAHATALLKRRRSEAPVDELSAAEESPRLPDLTIPSPRG